MTGTAIGEEGRESRLSQYALTEKSLESPRASQRFPSSFDLHMNRVDVYVAFDPNSDENTGELEEDSPYPEVRSAVANFDDPEMPASTLRSWTLGILISILIPGMNQFFHFRYPTVNIGPVVAQLLAFPVGSTWARWVPNVSLFGVLITIMAAVGSGSAYATDIVAVQKTFYDQSFSFPCTLLVISTQCIGFSIGGITRRFLVNPPSMIWPNSLVSCALFNTLHSQSYAGVGKHPGMSRERFSFTPSWGRPFDFVPGYLFQGLRCSYCLQACWIAPDNVIVNQLFGYRSGLGFSVITFDWNQIAYIGSPLATPWWAEVNGFLVPVLYYTNTWRAQYLPISSISAFDNTGKYYNHTRIIKDGKLDMEAYNAYSPLYLSTTFAMSYGLSFMSITATIAHAILHFSAPIKLHFKRSLREQPDVHAKLMMSYPQGYPPQFVTFIFACVCIQCWDTGMEIWALILALFVALLYVTPVGMIQANNQFVITELLVGFLLPGKAPRFKTYGYITMSRAIQFTADFKLGHYMKGSRLGTLLLQVVATLIAGTVQLGVQNWDICSPTQKDNFICAPTQVFGTASVVWGLIGPNLFFSKGQVYFALIFFFVIGAACPLLLWLFTRRRPNTILNYLRLIFSALGYIPPATAINFVPWAVFGFIFQFIVRRKHFSYWTKYNYVLSAALDAGTAVGVILVFFCLQYPLNGSIGRHSVLKWWGNTVFMETLDWKGAPLHTLLPQSESKKSYDTD
ncbi:small oligopeptide transporter [Mycena alexandri]|uniref:Small oligopeptide transporter n=1 Tax=Mycena alexandri TaxID=1745969 RepID=A0AAD6SDL1_9AGAR|nr:small oligopeptide transporter [Mycena alexandri]